jgi:hypothetical protein
MAGAAAKLDSAAQESYTNIRFRIVPNKDAPALILTERSRPRAALHSMRDGGSCKR